MGTYSRLDKGLRRVVARVAVLNLTYFGVEFSVALAIGSVSLFADSIDFLEDTSINFLILIALGWGARNRSRVGTVLAGILLIPGLATLWTGGWEKSCWSSPIARPGTSRLVRTPARTRGRPVFTGASIQRTWSSWTETTIEDARS